MAIFGLKRSFLKIAIGFSMLQFIFYLANHQKQLKHLTSTNNFCAWEEKENILKRKRKFKKLYLSNLIIKQFLDTYLRLNAFAIVRGLSFWYGNTSSDDTQKRCKKIFTLNLFIKLLRKRNVIIFHMSARLSWRL